MKTLPFALCLACALVLAGCSGGKPYKSNSSSSSSSSTTSSTSSSSSASSSSSSASSSSSGEAVVSAHFRLKITNLTAGQPLSPPAFVVHSSNFAAFTVGMPASLGVEKIAESGNPADFIADAKAHAGVVVADRGAGGIMPGHEQEIEIMLQVPLAQLKGLKLSYLSMLGNTNDAFVAIENFSLAQLADGASASVDALSFDAGTEMNDEQATTVPGPACSGEGFNAQRSDGVNQVTLHPGILSRQDGDVNSCLQTLQRWDNPAARVMITRLAL